MIANATGASHSRGAGFDRQDLVYLLLRVVSLAFMISFAVVAIPPASVVLRRALFEAYAVFAAYTLLLYLVGWRIIRGERRWLFYVVAASADLVFVLHIMSLTGGGYSPFYRALYLWVAMLAFFFGFRAGIAASSVAFAVFALIHLSGPVLSDAWNLAVQAGGLLLHGPVVGYLAERERQRSEALRRANQELAEAKNRFLQEEAKVIQAEKLSSLGLLAAGVAHEVNNPLMGVMGCVKALHDGTVPEPRREEYFHTVRDGLDRIRTTVHDLLEFARPRPAAPVELDLHEVVAATLRLLSPSVRKSGLKVENRLEPGRWHTFANRSQLMQAVLNLLLNAMHATPSGGEVAIRAERAGGRVGLHVTDTGCGISPEHLQRVCDPFFTTKPEGQGTGLGLAITLGIVRAMGGELAISSEVGRGTTATLWLPETATTEGKTAHA